VRIRLYRLEEYQSAAQLATANPKDTFAILTAEQVDAKSPRLISEARTDDQGAFAVELGENQDYGGGPFEVDVMVESEGQKQPLQFSITTLQPQWRQRKEGYLWVWNHCLPSRYWCRILAILDRWVICGRVLNCETQQAIPGVTVTAFDADWIQDDELGSAVTDGTGHFRIDYVGSDFKKTPFPPIEIELFGGPDLYFKVETAGGVALLEETQSRGREPDRENVGHCFCVTLCVEEPEPEFENPIFYQIGDFNIAADISLTTGLTLGPKAGHGGPNFGFFSKMKFKGFCPKTPPADPSQPLHYRFLFIDPDDPATEVPVTGSFVSPETVLGARIVPWDQFGTGTTGTYQDILLRRTGPPSAPDSLPVPPGPPPHGPVPPHILVPDSDGWVRVDQLAVDGGFFTLMGFHSPAAVPGGVATEPGDQAGSAPIVPKNGKLLTIIFETATDPSNPATYNRQLLEAKALVNNWVEVRLLNLAQFISGSAGSCTPITNQVDILYTVDHELLHSWSLAITSAASPPVPPLPSGSGPRGGNGTEVVNVTTWPSCSYVVRLYARRALTTGEVDDDQDFTQITFCK
jgi:hypothetical protein